MTNIIGRYRLPIVAAVVVVVLVVIVYFSWIAPEGSKLTTLNGQELQLQAQQAALQAQIAQLKHEKQDMGPTCSNLANDYAKIPSTPQVDSFFQQVSALAISSGDPKTPSINVSQSSAAGKNTSSMNAISVTLTLNGTYGQMTTFLQGLYNFPRLFTIASININGGNVTAGGGQAPPADQGDYTLALEGDIYYSAGQQDACTAASA